MHQQEFSFMDLSKKDNRISLLNNNYKTKVLDLKDFLVELKIVLINMGYQFSHPKNVITGVSPDTDKYLETLEKRFGSFPYSLACFYKFIGEVNFCGHHPQWKAIYADPMVVYSIDSVMEVFHYYVEHYQEEKKHHDDTYGGFCLPFGDDDAAKAGYSGDAYYICIPNDDNPVFLGEVPCKNFMDYLDVVYQMAGFPGLLHCQHTYPIKELKKKLPKLNSFEQA